MKNTDGQAQDVLAPALQAIDEYYKQRGIFQGSFGFAQTPAIVVVDFAYGWTDEAYAGGSRRLDAPVDNTRTLLAAGRAAHVPVIYTTSPFRPDSQDQPQKSAADPSPGFRAWDRRACEIDERVTPRPSELVIEKESASAFAGTDLVGHLIQHHVDTLLIAGCSTSACIRATATDAKSYRLKPVIVGDCVGDRSAVCHVFTLFDIQARFADVVALKEAVAYLEGLKTP